MVRSVPEWVGTHDDQPPPPRVKTRILERCEYKCSWTDRPIRAGDEFDFDHIVALCNGGENREYNLAPILRQAHKAKTKADMDLKKKITRTRQKHLGTYPKSRAKIRSRGFQSTREMW